jgi:hypothetical protein
MLLVGLLPFLVYGKVFHCMHDELPPIVIPQHLRLFEAALTDTWQSPAGGQPFRVFFDTTYLENPTPGVTCTSSSDVVTHSGRTWQCREEDMFGTDKKNAVIDTLENLRLFMLDLMKVVPVESQVADPAFQLYSYGGLYNQIGRAHV